MDLYYGCPITGHGDKRGKANTKFLLVGFGDFGHKYIHMCFVDDVQGTAPKTAAHHTGAQNSFFGMGKIHEKIKLGTTDFIFFALSLVRKVHELPQPRKIPLFQRFCRSQHAFVFLQDITAPAIKHIPQRIFALIHHS